MIFSALRRSPHSVIASQEAFHVPVESGPAPNEEVRRREILQVTGAISTIMAVAVLAVIAIHGKTPSADGPAADTPGPRLREALAALDQHDPHWRFAELEEDRAAVPAEENGAPTVMAAVKLIPSPWRGPSAEQVRQKLRAGLIEASPRADIEPANPALTEGRKLAGFRRGRFTVAWNLNDPLDTYLPHLSPVDQLVDVLSLDAEVRAHERDVDGALVSARAALVAVRCIGDEPMLTSQLGRLGWEHRVIDSLEELLRFGEGTEPRLAALQAVLLDEAAEPVLRLTARAERAGLHGLLTALEAGKHPKADRSLLGVRTDGVQLVLTNDRLRQRDALENIHAWVLDFTTQTADIARLPSQDQLPKLEQLADTVVQAPLGAGLLLAALPLREIGTTCLQKQALLRSAAVALALERFRLATGHWPQKLDELRPQYLSEVPADPFDGKPLRFARHKDMVVIYSVGPDGKDDGGKPETLNRMDRKAGFDVGFRLWNMEARKIKK